MIMSRDACILTCITHNIPNGFAFMQCGSRCEPLNDVVAQAQLRSPMQMTAAENNFKYSKLKPKPCSVSNSKRGLPSDKEATQHGAHQQQQHCIDIW